MPQACLFNVQTEGNPERIRKQSLYPRQGEYRGIKLRNESQSKCQENLRQVQDHQARRRRAGDLREQEAQAATGLGLEKRTN